MLKLNANELHQHITNLPLGVVEWDNNFILKSITPFITEMLGYEPDDLIGYSAPELTDLVVVEADRDHTFLTIDNLREGKTEHTRFDIRLCGKNEEVRYTRWYNSALWNQGDQLVSVCSLVEDLTEQKETESKRKRSAEILDATPDFIGISDLDGNIIALNPAGRKLLDLKSDVDPSDLNVSHIFAEKSLKLIQSGILPQICEQGNWQGELTLKTHDNAQIPVSAVIQGHRDDQGKVTYFSTICRDITQEIKAKRRLSEREQQLSLAMDAGKIGLWEYFPQKNYMHFDKDWMSHYLGYPPEELSHSSNTWLNLIREKERTEVISEMESHIRGETDYFEKELPFETKSGTYTWMLLRAKVMDRNDSGRALRLIGVHIDVNERKSMEQKLERENLFIQTVIESLPSTFYMIDENRRFVLWNKNLEKYFSYSSEEIRNMDALDFFKQEERPLVLNALAEAIEYGESNFEANVIDKYGKTSPYYIMGQKFEQDEESFIMGTALDITKHKHYEQSLRDTIQEKHILLQEIHHRVKNNLAVISSFLQMQSFYSDEQSVKKPLLDSHNRVMTMAKIHEKLYNSKSLANIELDDYFEELGAEIQKTLDTESNITIHLNIDKIRLNVTQAVPCALIINELLSNALTHAFKNALGGGEITVSCEQVDNRITFSVKDNGQGITEKVDAPYKSLGYQIIHTLIRQLDADYEMFNDNGAHIRFSFIKTSDKDSDSVRTGLT